MNYLRVPRGKEVGKEGGKQPQVLQCWVSELDKSLIRALSELWWNESGPGKALPDRNAAGAGMLQIRAVAYKMNARGTARDIMEAIRTKILNK